MSGPLQSIEFAEFLHNIQRAKEQFDQGLLNTDAVALIAAWCQATPHLRTLLGQPNEKKGRS